MNHTELIITSFWISMIQYEQMWSNLNQLLFHLIDFNRRSFRQNIRHFMMMKVPYLMMGEAKAVHQKLLELSLKIFSIWDLLHTVQFNLIYWNLILIALNQRLKEESFHIQRLHSLCPMYPDSIVTSPLQKIYSRDWRASDHGQRQNSLK